MRVSIKPGPSKRREKHVAKAAENEEPNEPVDGVDVNDDHVHVETPASGVVLKVQVIQGEGSSVGELTSHTWAGLPLEAWFEKQLSPLFCVFFLVKVTHFLKGYF